MGHHGAMRIGVLGAGRIGQAHAANLTLVEGVDEVVPLELACVQGLSGWR